MEDTSIVEESAIARAQCLVQQAMDAAHLLPPALARKMKRSSQFGAYVLQSNLTIRTLARALAACGYEVEFHLRKRP